MQINVLWVHMEILLQDYVRIVILLKCLVLHVLLMQFVFLVPVMLMDLHLIILLIIVHVYLIVQLDIFKMKLSEYVQFVFNLVFNVVKLSAQYVVSVTIIPFTIFIKGNV